MGNVPGGNAEEGGQPFQFAGRRDDGAVLVVRIDPEGQLSQLQHDAHRPHEGPHLVARDADGVQSVDGVLPLFSVGLALDGRHATGAVVSASSASIVDVPVHDAVVHQPVPYGRPGIVRCGEELVEDVVVALAGLVSDDATLLEQVGLAVRSGEEAGGDRPAAVRGLGGILDVELQADVLAEARRVVVPDRPGVAERLEEGVGVQDAADDGVVARMVPDVMARPALRAGRLVDGHHHVVILLLVH